MSLFIHKVQSISSGFIGFAGVTDFFIIHSRLTRGSKFEQGIEISGLKNLTKEYHLEK